MEKITFKQCKRFDAFRMREPAFKQFKILELPAEVETESIYFVKPIGSRSVTVYIVPKEKKIYKLGIIPFKSF